VCVDKVENKEKTKKTFEELIDPSFGNIIDPAFHIIREDSPCKHAESGKCPYAYQNEQGVVHCKLAITWHPVTEVDEMTKCFKGKYNYNRDKLAARNRLRKKFPGIEEDTLSF